MRWPVSYRQQLEAKWLKALEAKYQDRLDTAVSDVRALKEMEDRIKPRLGDPHE